MNVKHRQCAEQGCSTRPAFNWKGEEKGQFCNKHKEKGMINVDRKDARPGEHPWMKYWCLMGLSGKRYMWFGIAC